MCYGCYIIVLTKQNTLIHKTRLKSNCPLNPKFPGGQNTYYVPSPRHIYRRMGEQDDLSRPDAFHHWQARRQDHWPGHERLPYRKRCFPQSLRQDARPTEIPFHLDRSGGTLYDDDQRRQLTSCYRSSCPTQEKQGQVYLPFLPD